MKGSHMDAEAQSSFVMGQALISSEGVQGARANDTTGDSKLVAPPPSTSLAAPATVGVIGLNSFTNFKLIPVVTVPYFFTRDVEIV